MCEVPAAGGPDTGPESRKCAISAAAALSAAETARMIPQVSAAQSGTEIMPTLLGSGAQQRLTIPALLKEEIADRKHVFPAVAAQVD